MPAGALVTVPVPVPLFVVVRVNAGVPAVKVAVMASAEFAVSGEVPVRVQAPLHPANVAPGSGVAMSVSCLPCASCMLQVVPHTNPDGDDVTTPVPVPAFVTVIEGVVEATKLAVTLSAALIVTLHIVEGPLHAPLQLSKAAPMLAVAVRPPTEPPADMAPHGDPPPVPGGRVFAPARAPRRRGTSQRYGTPPA